MSDILTKIVARKREVVAERKRTRPLEALQRALSQRPPRDFAAALRAPGLSIIAEFKRRSPSKGDIAMRHDLGSVVHDYCQAGAAALSILTDEDFFNGQDDDVRVARGAVGLPILRKDFTIDPYQVYEARAIGADAILLIAACLDDAQLRNLHALASELHLAAVVEVHDEHELERAINAGARIIGVNNRDLRTFEVSLETSLRLRPRIPANCIAVAESGIRTGEDARRLAGAGFDAILVGESLLTAADPPAKLRELLSDAGVSRARCQHTLVKVCGITTIDDARAAAEAGADLIGLVFAESPRRVLAEQARRIVDALPRTLLTVGVFMNQPLDLVINLRDAVDLDLLQLHGEETADFGSRLNRTFIKRIRVEPNDTSASLRRRVAEFGPIDQFLLDPGAGSGQPFDWNIAAGLGKRAFVSGGLTPENVASAMRAAHPYGVDVSSGVERSPGRKDHVKMRDFVQAVREADASRT